jgi:HEAT repeat protein
MPSEAAPQISKHEAAPLNADTTVDAAPHASPSSPEAASTPTATPEVIAQWISDTQSADARTRAAAIAALAQAPKAQAVPALERVLESGEPEVDRQIALRSLHSLAMQDGDPDGSIRDAMRRAMYHGDDEGVTQTAQDLLDDNEAEIATRAESR